MSENMLNELLATQRFNERSARALARGHLDEAYDGADKRARQERRRKRRERVARALSALAAWVAPPAQTIPPVHDRAPATR